MPGDDRPPSSGLEATLVVPPARTIAGKYQLGRMLGEGGMGSVYEAEHIGLGKRVAIKLLSENYAEDETFVKRFRREARALAAVQHDNVVQVTDTGTDDEGVPFIVMELLDGEPLASVLRRERALPVETSADIAAQVLAGLSAAHRKGIIHRDLKPANVFLATNEEGVTRVKVLDFGISKFATDRTNLNVTAEGAVIGTPAFMSPEQVKGITDADLRMDLYAVGVMLYRMVTGKLPFPGKKAREIYDRILRGDATPPHAINPDVTPELDDVIRRAMALEPGDRFPDAESFFEALRRAVPGMDSTGPLPVFSRSSAFPPPLTDSDASTRRARPSAGVATPAAQRDADGAEGAPPAKGRRALLGLAAAGALLAIVGGLLIVSGQDRTGEDAAGSPPRDPDPVAQHGAAPLRYGVPVYAPIERIEETHQPLAHYLSERLQRPVELVVTHDFELAGELDSGEIGLAALSPYRYVVAKEAHPDLRLLATAVNPGGSSYVGQILVRPDSGITSLRDLVGKEMCFPSRESTSGYLYPRALFRQQGIDPDTAFRAVYFQGGDHEATLRALAAGECDGAAVYQSAVADAGFDPQTFHPLASTPRIPYDAYCVSSDVPESEARAIRDALLSLEPNQPHTLAILGAHGALRGFARASDHDYDSVREIRDYIDAPEQPTEGEQHE